MAGVYAADLAKSVADEYLGGMKSDADEARILISKIVRALKARGFSQDQFEIDCRLARGRISKWLAGQGEPDGRQVWRMAKMLGVDVAYLLDPDRQSPALPDWDEFELPTKIMRELGAKEALRRLLQENRGSVAPQPDPGYSQGHPVDEPRLSRRKEGA